MPRHTQDYNKMSEEEHRTANPKTILNRFLSSKIALPCDEDLTSERNPIVIGRGQCGTVYATGEVVVKQPNSPEKIDELFTDHQSHSLVQDAFAKCAHLQPKIQVPLLGTLLTPSWDEMLWIEDRHTHGHGLVTEKITTLPLPVRKAIVEHLCPISSQENFNELMQDPDNSHCLIRIYLGRRHDPRTNHRRTNLRNFPLHFDELERLDLDVRDFARRMAISLAIMHWKAGVDANDVEFVLGNTTEGRATVWLLDFNQCKPFEQTEDGLKKIVQGFWFNDPYYPRPNSVFPIDKRMWEVFRDRYLETSRTLTTSDWPQRFIDGVVDEGVARRKSVFGY